MRSNSSNIDRGVAVSAFCLIAVTILAYLPAILHGGFVFDDFHDVTQNNLLRSVHGLVLIWTRVRTAPGKNPFQYYPLTYSVFWIEYHLWGLRPLGYHLVNVLLQAANAILVWRILRRLSVPGALLAAAIFALHPVHVESVAWVAELKNILAVFFYLASISCYLRFLGFEEAGSEQGREHLPFYFLAFFLFICALASKTAIVTLPAAILLITWWKTGNISRRDWFMAVPMLILSAGAGFLTESIERTQLGAKGAGWTLKPIEHILLAGRVPWFYAGKLIWPSRISFVYPRWEISQAVWWQYLFPLALIAVLLILWGLRHRIGRGPLAAVLFFCGTLTPAMGFANVYFMRYSYVSDHFQYPASLGLIVLFSAIVTRACLNLESRFGGHVKKAALIAAGIMLTVLGSLTWKRCRVYKSPEDLWADTIAENPSAWLAQNNLGVYLNRAGEYKEAEKHLVAAIGLKHDYVEAHFNLGISFEKQGKLDEAIAQYGRAAEFAPEYADARINLAEVLAQRGRTDEAIFQIQQALKIDPNSVSAHVWLGLLLADKGLTNEAINQYRRALGIDPNSVSAHSDLANALFSQGYVAEAVAQYRAALSLNPAFAQGHNNLGYVLATQHDIAAAIEQFRLAVKADPNYAQAQLNWGMALASEGKLNESIRHLQEALRLSPGNGTVKKDIAAVIKMNKTERRVP